MTWRRTMVDLPPEPDGHHRLPFLGRDLTPDEQATLDAHPTVQVSTEAIDGLAVATCTHPALPLITWSAGYATDSPHNPHFIGSASATGNLIVDEYALAPDLALAATTLHAARRLGLSGKVPEVFRAFITGFVQDDLNPAQAARDFAQIYTTLGLTDDPITALLKIIGALEDRPSHRLGEDDGAGPDPDQGAFGPQVHAFSSDQIPDDLPPEVRQIVQSFLDDHESDQGNHPGVRVRRGEISEVRENANPANSAKITFVELGPKAVHWTITPNGAENPVRQGTETSWEKAQVVAKTIAEEVLKATLN